MAWYEITEPKDVRRSFAADTDDDKTKIAAAAPDAPVGSVIIADNSGSTHIFMKFPGGWSQMSGSSGS